MSFLSETPLKQLFTIFIEAGVRYERDMLTFPESGIEDILITAKDFSHE